MSDQDNALEGLDGQQGNVEQRTEEETPREASSSDTQLDDLLAEIKNERGEQKYGSPEEALKGAAHAQEYIRQLKEQQEKLQEEFQNMKLELEKRSSVRDTVERALAANKEEESGEPAAQSFGKQDVLSILEEREQAKIQEQNVKEVSRELTSLFGDQSVAKQQFIKTAEEIGATPAELYKLASQKPKMVLSLFKKSGGQAHDQKMSENKVNTQQVMGQNQEAPKKFETFGATMDDIMNHWNSLRKSES